MKRIHLSSSFNSISVSHPVIHNFTFEGSNHQVQKSRDGIRLQQKMRLLSGVLIPLSFIRILCWCLEVYPTTTMICAIYTASTSVSFTLLTMFIQAPMMKNYTDSQTWELVAADRSDKIAHRKGHSAAVVGDIMVIHGGTDKDSRTLADFQLFHIGTLSLIYLPSCLLAFY